MTMISAHNNQGSRMERREKCFPGKIVKKGEGVRP